MAPRGSNMKQRCNLRQLLGLGPALHAPVDGRPGDFQTAGRLSDSPAAVEEGLLDEGVFALPQPAAAGTRGAGPLLRSLAHVAGDVLEAHLAPFHRDGPSRAEVP